MFVLNWLGKGLSYLFYYLPYSAQTALGWFLGILWFDIFRIRRSVILANLEIAFPNKTRLEKLQIGRASCFNLGMTFVEFCKMSVLTKKDKNQFLIEGYEYLVEAQKSKKGVILLTLHLGNLDWAAAGLALHEIPLTVISKEFSWRWLNSIWFGVRKRLGLQFIAPRGTSLAILKSLKRQEIVVFVHDQYMGPPIGVKTRFFGKETGTAMGLALLAGRSGAAVVPAYTVRLASGITKICFEKQIPFAASEDNDETIKRMTQLYNNKLEEFVVRYPEQWMWVHRRWKKFTG